MSDNAKKPAKGLKEQVYDDLASPAMKKVGMAIANVAELVYTATLPIEMLNKKAKMNFDQSIKKYQQKLDAIPVEQIVEVPSEISFPVLNRFRYVSNEQLNDAFVNLLTCASTSETASSAHPGFITIIDRLSPDEAKLLKFLKSEYFIPSIIMKAYTVDSSGYYTYRKRTGLEKLVAIDFPRNMDVYLDNLESLGLIQMRNYYIQLGDRYNYLKNEYKNDRADFRGELDSNFQDPEWEMECYVITAFCRLFMDACIK